GVLLQDVDRRGRDVVAPDQIDQLVGADRPARPDQQQRQQIGLLPGPGIQLDPVPPQAKMAEDLQAHALASHRAAPARAVESGPLYSTRDVKSRSSRPPGAGDAATARTDQ